MQEKNLLEIVKYIKKEKGIDIFTKNRNRPYPQYKSLFETILRKKYNLGDTEISHFYASQGFKRHSATIKPSISNFETYCKMMPSLLDDLDYFINPNKQRNLSPLQELVSDIPKSRESELMETIKLKIKSWSWKSQDKITIIEGY